LSHNTAQSVPEGWLTRHQWEGVWGVSTSTANKLLRVGLASGRMEAKVFRVPVGLRGVYSTPHYRERVARPDPDLGTKLAVSDTKSPTVCHARHGPIGRAGKCR